MKKLDSLNKAPTLSLVIPAYNEEEVVDTTIKVLNNKLNSLIEKGIISKDSFLCFVDDGSKDSTFIKLKQTAVSKTMNLKVIKLSKNYGHQNALLAGLNFVTDKCDCCISIDCDLQDDINVFYEFIQKYKEGNEIIYGVRNKRDTDSIFKRKSAIAFYDLMLLMGVKIIHNHADYRLLSNRAIKALLEFKEVNLFLRGIVPMIGFKSTEVKYDRLERSAGISKYPLRKMLSFAWNGITSFSIMPLRIVSVMGFVFFVLSILLGVYVVCVKLFGNGFVISGWASTLIIISFFSGIQLLSLGIIGEYIGKIYAESKNRPRFFIEEII